MPLSTVSRTSAGRRRIAAPPRTGVLHSSCLRGLPAGRSDSHALRSWRGICAGGIRPGAASFQFGDEQGLGEFKSGYGGVAGDGGKVVKKLIKRLSALKVVQESLKGDARAAEDGCAAENLRISDDHYGWGNHGMRRLFPSTLYLTATLPSVQQLDVR